VISQYVFITGDKQVTHLQALLPLNFNKSSILIWSEEPYNIWEAKRAGQAQRAFNGTVCWQVGSPSPSSHSTAKEWREPHIL